MPSENKTKNLSLNQWQGNEYAKRQDFVDDNKKIDDAIGELKNSIGNVKIPVTSVNNKDGDVVLKATDINCNDGKSVESHLEDNMNYCLERMARDNEGIYTKIIHKRKDGTKILESVLSGGVSPQYTTKTVSYFNVDGTIIIKKTYILNYNSYGEVISEVLANE